VTEVEVYRPKVDLSGAAREPIEGAQAPARVERDTEEEAAPRATAAPRGSAAPRRPRRERPQKEEP
jgi:hypothetical protein